MLDKNQPDVSRPISSTEFKYQADASSTLFQIAPSEAQKGIESIEWYYGYLKKCRIGFVNERSLYQK